jgi:hypothetical protein
MVDLWDEIVGRYTSAEEVNRTSNTLRENTQFRKQHTFGRGKVVIALMQLSGIDRDTAERAIRDVKGGDSKGRVKPPLADLESVGTPSESQTLPVVLLGSHLLNWQRGPDTRTVSI